MDDWSRHCPGDWDGLRPALLEQLSAEIAEHSIKAFVLEAEILRLRLKGGDAGSGPTATQSFARHVRECPRYVQTLWVRYAGLARLVATAVLQWHANMGDLFRRLASDTEAIAGLFGIAADAGLAAIESTQSDPHDGGRRVLVVHFRDGKKLVYKPRPVRIDAAFQSCLGWLNAAGFSPPLRQLRVLDRPGYGWIEFEPTAAQAPINRVDDAPQIQQPTATPQNSPTPTVTPT